VQNVTWTSDGLPEQGWLMLPMGADPAAKRPLVTVVHGGPAWASQPYFFAPGFNRTLLEHGYALFLPNPRGSFGQGEAFTRANIRDLGHGDLRDILAGVDAAVAAAPIDPARLGITGVSYGGFMTMWAGTQTHRFRAGVAVAGISDWLSYTGTAGTVGWLLPYFGALIYDDPSIYARSSPLEDIRDADMPTLSMVGQDDIECPPGQTIEFWHALQAMHVPADAVVYPGEGHGLRDPADVADSAARAIAWFAAHMR
jgi:dipeptidyl aminopeptidase/acylaminoacyl peptidase